MFKATMISQYELQSTSAQDMVKTGKDWMVVCDGHGKGAVIRYLRTLDWEEMVLCEDPTQRINSSIRALGNTIADGATMSMVRICDDGIDCKWIGDSQIRVFADEVEVWRSSNHNRENASEVSAHLEKGGTTDESMAIKIVNPDTITMVPSRYFVFSKRERLAMTRSLGHNELYEPSPTKHFIPFSDFPVKTNWKIVVGTDGLWDMICPQDDELIASSEADAKALSNFALSRWKQPWTYKHPPPHKTTSFGEYIYSTRDDISVAVWQKKI